VRFTLDRVVVSLGLNDIERRLHGLGASRAAGILIEGARKPAREPLGLHWPSLAVVIDDEIRIGGHIGGVEEFDALHEPQKDIGLRLRPRGRTSTKLFG
jgi:hypothetical protein